jgi:C4-type Zn-finger protein
MMGNDYMKKYKCPLCKCRTPITTDSLTIEEFKYDFGGKVRKYWIKCSGCGYIDLLKYDSKNV